MGASRLRNNAARSPAAILMPHRVRTRKEVAAHSQVVMIGDQTECNVSSHQRLQGAGSVGRGSAAQGFGLPSALARDAHREELLGCAFAQSVMRQPAPAQGTKGQRTPRARESPIWEQRVRGIGPVPKGS